METFGLITLYSVLMMAFLGAIAAGFSFLAMWLAKESADGDAAH